MFEANRKFRKPIWVNFSVLTLLLVTSGFTLSGCQKVLRGGKTTDKPKENSPAKVEQHKSSKQLKQKQSAKSNQKKNKDDDTQDDDDPE
jgi:hypothetical protein